MAWTASKIFMAFIEDKMEVATLAMDLDADNIKAALWGDATPDQTVTSANSAYGAGVWASGGTSDATGWPAVGRQLLSVTSGRSSNVYTFDAADTVSANDTTTLASTYGCLVYDDTVTTPVADQGICYNYFGGASTVTSGRFTIVWHTSGIMAITA